MIKNEIKKIVSITILLLVIFLSPLIAEDKILKCEPKKWRSDPSSYYKMKTSLLFFKSYYLRVGEKWIPFCEDIGSAITRSSPDIQNRQSPIEKIKGDNAVLCVWHGTREDNDKRFYEKLKIDFDLNSSTYCFDNTDSFITQFLHDGYDKNKADISFNCSEAYKDLKCEVIE